MLVPAPVYTAELAPPRLRGLFVGMNDFFIAFGYGMAAWMGLAFYYATDPLAQWRGTYGLSLVFNAIPLLVALVAPESPR